ncbi:hypothetical protein niasHS_016094 [Heterodera schachtii]|uniref:Secreted protein n=1 Tax=Heterodera schachtii TaxID=97005 RepID=A0ABD2HRN1_HETSC
MLRQCRCCAIIVLFSLYVAFLKFISIDAGCGGSKETEAQPKRAYRDEWSPYCGSIRARNKDECNNHQVRPCLIHPTTRVCVAATINAAESYVNHNDEWNRFCQNNLQQCAQTKIKPCTWVVRTSREEKCVAKGSGNIFVRAH